MSRAPASRASSWQPGRCPGATPYRCAEGVPLRLFSKGKPRKAARPGLDDESSRCFPELERQRRVTVFHRGPSSSCSTTCSTSLPSGCAVKASTPRPAERSARVPAITGQAVLPPGAWCVAYSPLYGPAASATAPIGPVSSGVRAFASALAREDSPPHRAPVSIAASRACRVFSGDRALCTRPRSRPSRIFSALGARTCSCLLRPSW